MMKRIELDFHDAQYAFESGVLARQAHGSVLASCGDTLVLATAVVSSKPREHMDFLPLSCDYQERPWAAGKIPGGFFKREGRPNETEILVSRMIDRPLRPLFPEGWRREIQIIVNVLSKDEKYPSDVLAITAASAALNISKIPFAGPLAGVRVGRVDGKLICNPTHQQIDEGDLDIIVVGSENAVTMVEGGARFAPEKDIVEAIMFGFRSLQPFIQVQKDLRDALGAPKIEYSPPEQDPKILDLVSRACAEDLNAALAVAEKSARQDTLRQVKEDMLEKLAEAGSDDEAPDPKELSKAFGTLKYNRMRRMIIEEGRRIDGRSFADIRPISCQVGILPRPHGSALFTRGETQALVIITLGTRSDEQKIETLSLEEWRKFMLHYNFPPFSVGEAKFLRGPGRREIGHGVLARRGLELVLPDTEKFPYTIRVVSEILESNGSSSMATVCGASLAMMHAAIPISQAVAGIAMGLVKEGDNYAILSDILGDEDHIGDMDFKVIGNREGVSAIQMDIKITGVTEEILQEALQQAREGRLHILDEMDKTISEPASEMSPYAPRIFTVQIPVDRIRDLIGPGGKHIRAIVEKTGVKIDVEDDGRVLVASPDGEKAQEAIRLIRAHTAEPEIGKFYLGRVTKIMDFGAFVEILPGQDGLVHISQIANERIQAVSDVLKEGDEFLVKCLDIDRMGRIRLSRREALGLNPDDVLE